MKINKRIISLSLVSCLVINPMALLATEQIFGTDVMSNFTPANTWEDKRTGITYHSGNKGVYKFKRSNYFPPMLEISPPKAAITCSGFSFDLGFVGIMNLDGIEEQLKEASQAFMWGILTAFKLSTPNLSAVFEYINEIIRQIQDMLANACSAGREFAKGLNGGKDIDVFGVVDNELGSAASTMKGYAEKLQKGNRGELFKGALERISSKPAAEKKETIQSITSDISFEKLIKNKLLINSSNALFHKVDFNTVFSANENQPGFVYFNSGNLSKIVQDKKIAYFSSDDTDGSASYIDLDPTTFETNKKMMILAEVFFGSNMLSANDTKVIGEWHSFYNKPLDQVIQNLNDNADTESKPKDLTLSAPVDTVIDTNDVMSKLKDGDDVNSSNTFCMPDYPVYFIGKSPTRKENKIVQSGFGTLLLVKTNSINSNLCLKWDGAQKGSKDGIAFLLSHILNRQISIDSNGITITGTGKNPSPSSINGIPLVVDSSMDDLQIIAQYIRVKKYNPDGMVKDAINYMIEENAQALSNNIIDLAFQGYLLTTHKNDITSDKEALKKSFELVTAYKQRIASDYTLKNNKSELFREMKEVIAGSRTDKNQ